MAYTYEQLVQSFIAGSNVVVKYLSKNFQIKVFKYNSYYWEVYLITIIYKLLSQLVLSS